MLSKLWTAIQGLRQLNREAPEVLRVAAARRASEVQRFERAVKEKQEYSLKAAETINKAVETLQRQKDALLEARKQRLEERLNTVTIDPAVVQQRVMTNAVDNWEKMLLKAGPQGATPAATGKARDAEDTAPPKSTA